MLDRLPYCLLQSLPGYIHTLPDFRSLILTSSVLYTHCGSPTPQQLLRLAVSPETHLQPYPHLLLAVKARALSAHSVRSRENLAELHAAIKNGPEAILNLALKISPLQKEDLQRLHEARKVVDELTDILEPECAPSSVENDPIIMCNNVSLALINYWIYCELFSTTIEAQYRKPATSILHLPSAKMRRNWFVFCVPDENSRRWRDHPFVGDIDSQSLSHLDMGEGLDDDEEYEEPERPILDYNRLGPPMSPARHGLQTLDLMTLSEYMTNMFDQILIAIILKPHHDSDDGSIVSRLNDAQNVVKHLGIDYLRLLLPGAECRPIPENVKEVIEASEKGEVKPQIPWMVHQGWHSMQKDFMATMVLEIKSTF